MLAADILATAAVTIGFGGYVRHLLGTPLTVNALALVVVLGVILYSGVRRLVAIAIVLTILEAAGLLFVIVIGLPFWRETPYLVAAPSGLAGISGAAALIFFAYLGFDELGNFAEEMRDPERDLPALCTCRWPPAPPSTCWSRCRPLPRSAPPSSEPPRRRWRWSRGASWARMPTSR
jgi:basic amino acid/polyamine antiporter, APA family